MTPDLGFVAGMTWGWDAGRGKWTLPNAEDSMEKMAAVGVNYITLAFSVLQRDPQSVEIPYWDEPTVTDDEIRWAAKKARQLGLKICLKPVVNCANGTWRAHICFFDEDVPGEPTWGQWFESYRNFMVHYAKLAQELGCELFCVGCEMVQSDKREAEWRQVIEAVREEYTGPVTYNCDKYQEDRVKWWDAVDVISGSGYYPVGTWNQELDRIEKVVQKYQKPFIFMESGCPSRVGSANRPNDWTLDGEASEDDQDLFYHEMFDTCDKRSWVGGYMLWDWPTKLYDAKDAPENRDYCMYAKRAEHRIREYYTKKLQA